MRRLHQHLLAGGALLGLVLAGCAHNQSAMPDFVANKPVLGFDPLKDPIPPAEELRDLGFENYQISMLVNPTASPSGLYGVRNKFDLYHAPGPDGRRVVLAITTGTEGTWTAELPKAGDLQGRVTEVRRIGWVRLGMLYSLNDSGLYVACRGTMSEDGQSCQCSELVRFRDLERFVAHWGPLVSPDEVVSQLAEENRAGRFSEELVGRLLAFGALTPEQQALVDQSKRFRLRDEVNQILSGKIDGDSAARTLSRLTDRFEPDHPFRAASMRFVAGVLGKWDVDQSRADKALLALAGAYLPPFVVHIDAELPQLKSPNWKTLSPSDFAASGPVLRDRLWFNLFRRSRITGQPQGAIVVTLGAPIVEVARVHKSDGVVQDVTRQVEVFDIRSKDLPRIEQIKARLAEIGGGLTVQRGRLGNYAGDGAAGGVVTDHSAPGLRPAPAAQRQGGGESGSTAWRKASAREAISELESERESLSNTLAWLSTPTRHMETVTTREYVSDAQIEGWQTTTTIPIELRAPDGTVVKAQSVSKEDAWLERDWEKEQTAEYMKEKAQKYPAVSWPDLWKVLGPLVTPHVDEKTAALSDQTERALARYFLGMQETPGPWLDTVLGELGDRKAAPNSVSP